MTIQTIKLNKHQVDVNGNQESGYITINNGKVVKARGKSGITLCSEDIYNFDTNYFTESLSMHNLKFFMQVKSTSDYKQSLLKAIDIFIKESYAMAFIKYAIELNDNNAKKLRTYKEKMNYNYWESWFNDFGSSDKWIKSELKRKQRRSWRTRYYIIFRLKEEYYTSDDSRTNKELANDLDELLNDPQNWAMFDNPTQAREDFQTYVNSFRLEELHKYSQQLAHELYF